jgi:hypothetical protein
MLLQKEWKMFSELLLVFFINLGSNIEWSRWSLIMMWVIVIFSCLNLLDRSDFVNVNDINMSFF